MLGNAGGNCGWRRRIKNLTLARKIGHAPGQFLEFSDPPPRGLWFLHILPFTRVESHALLADRLLVVIMSTIPGNSLEAPDEVHASRDGQRRDRAADPLIPGRPVAYLTAYALSILITAVCTALAAAMYRRFDLSNIIMVYLLGVVVAATRFGRGPAILSSILSVAAFDFCFVPPRWTLDVSDTQYLVTFAVMLVVSIVISTLTHRVREQAVSAQRRERRTAALLALTRELAATRGLEDILRIWDALGPKYRLSVSYIARVVRIDRPVASGTIVTARRFAFTGNGVTK